MEIKKEHSDKLLTKIKTILVTGYGLFALKCSHPFSRN